MDESLTEDELRKAKPWLFAPCWRCGDPPLRHDWDGPDDAPPKPSAHYDSEAVVSLRCSDGSYSGTYHVPLCWACAKTLHGDLPEGWRIL